MKKIFTNIQNLIEQASIEKAYTEGVYADTPQNRKLGRVGMSYAAYAEKIKKDNNNKKEKEENINEKKIFKDINDLSFTEKKSFPFGRKYGERKIGSANGHIYHIDTPATKKGKYFVDGKVCKDKEEFLKKINKLPKEGKFKNVNELPFGEKTRTRSGGWFRECTINGHLFAEYDKEHGWMHGKYEVDYEPVSKTEFLSLANDAYDIEISKDKKDDNFIKSITNQLQESLNENSIYCYEVNTKETKEGNTIFEAICSKDDLVGITTMDKFGQKLKKNLKPLLGGLELQDISFTDYKGKKQIKLTFDF